MSKNVKIPIDVLKKIIVSNVVDNEIFVEACIDSYIYNPTVSKNFIRDAIKCIYNAITYSDSNANTASSNIGSYVNESILLTELISIHHMLTTLVTEQIPSNFNNITIVTCDKDSVVFHVTT